MTSQSPHIRKNKKHFLAGKGKKDYWTGGIIFYKNIKCRVLKQKKNRRYILQDIKTGERFENISSREFERL